MSEGEARALLFAGLPGAAADLGLAAEVTAARLKLLAALPAGLRDEAARTAAVFHVDAPGWYRDPDRTPHLPVFVDATLTQRVVETRYRRWRAPQEVSRRLRPYGLVLKSGVW
ncbi:WYL domain-containing protein [Streptomyces virginiae]|uniref:WYL domain-containing protein n=1 Tax=Streptomyces virginiae TaxID=1961 RepID=UPI0037BCACF5